MDIDGMGASVVEELFGEHFLYDIPDIYVLKDHRSEIKELDGWSDRSIDSLLQGIEESKGRSLERLLFGLQLDFGDDKPFVLSMKHVYFPRMIPFRNQVTLFVDDARFAQREQRLGVVQRDFLFELVSAQSLFVRRAFDGQKSGFVPDADAHRPAGLRTDVALHNVRDVGRLFLEAPCY